MNSSGSLHPAPLRIPEPLSVAIVGGGIIGLSTAWRLAQRGFLVTVYDQSTLGGEASWAGAGMLAPGGEVEGESALASAAITSRQMYPAFISELQKAAQTDIDYQECGALELAYSASELHELEHRAAIQTAIGIPSKPVSLTSVQTFWPRVQVDGLAGARFYPQDAIVNPREVVTALIGASRYLGVTFRENCVASEAKVAPDHIALSAGDEISSYAAVVLAAGAWSSGMRIAGVPPVPASEPVKGHILGYLQPDQTCTTIVRRAGTYLLQRSNGMLLAGASVERVGFARDVRPEITATLAANAGAILPHLAETTPTESWIGFRPGSDALHVGRWHSDRFYLAYGHFRNGILLAPWTASLLSDAIASSLGRP